MTTVNAFGDVLGPRGRRRTTIATVISLLVVAGLIALAVLRFAEKGQLDADKWDELLTPQFAEFMLPGLVNTLKAALLAGFFSLVGGTIMALGRLSRIAPLRWAATTYVQLFRALPSLLLILSAYFGLRAAGVQISTLWALVLGLSLYNSAVVAEIVRAGVVSLPKGQSEAAYALGLTRGQAQRLVLLPQAFLRMLPSLVSQLVVVLKDTAYGFVIAFEELLRRAQTAGEATGDPLQAFLLVALVYIALCFAVSRIARYLEIRQGRRYGGRVTVVGEADQAI